MAARPAWKGLLKLSLVTIPVRAYPATNPSSDVSFHQLHRRCHTRIQLKKWCPHCKQEVTKDDIVKGHESSKGRTVIVEAEEIEALRPRSSQGIEISHVVAASTIDPIYIERAYYLAPDGKSAASPFAVIRDALDGNACIGRMTQHGREYLTAVIPTGSILRLYTLRTAGEVRDERTIGDAGTAGRVKAEEAKLARRILDSFETDIDLSQIVDNYQEALRRMLKAKGEGEPVAAEPPAPTKVVNLMEALRKSLAAVSNDRARPANTGRRKPARVVTLPAAKRRRTG